MNLEQLLTLKDKLVTAKEFKEPLDYFFDHFGEDPDFFEVGERADNPFLESMVAIIGKELFKKEEILVSHFLVVEIPGYHFFHGTCFIQGNVSNFLYFEDIDMGLLAVFISAMRVTQLVRFSSLKLEGGGRTICFNPSTN